MPQDYQITDPNFRDSPFNGTANNYIPYRPTNTLNSIVGPLFRIPTPTVSQILLDNLPIYQVKPNPLPLEIINSKPTSKLGTPVIDTLKFKVVLNPNQKFISSLKTEFINGFTYLFLEDVLVTVSQAKKIIRTEIAGNNGTVKEFIGLDDYHVTITGRLTGNYYDRPADQLSDLKIILDINKTITIYSDYFTDLGIEDFVIESYDLPQVEGQFTTQFFTINLVSDNRPENNFIVFFT